MNFIFSFAFPRAAMGSLLGLGPDASLSTADVSETRLTTAVTSALDISTPSKPTSSPADASTARAHVSRTSNHETILLTPTTTTPSAVLTATTQPTGTSTSTSSSIQAASITADDYGVTVVPLITAGSAVDRPSHMYAPQTHASQAFATPTSSIQPDTNVLSQPQPMQREVGFGVCGSVVIIILLIWNRKRIRRALGCSRRHSVRFEEDTVDDWTTDDAKLAQSSRILDTPASAYGGVMPSYFGQLAYKNGYAPHPAMQPLPTASTRGFDDLAALTDFRRSDSRYPTMRLPTSPYTASLQTPNR